MRRSLLLSAILLALAAARVESQVAVRVHLRPVVVIAHRPHRHYDYRHYRHYRPVPRVLYFDRRHHRYYGRRWRPGLVEVTVWERGGRYFDR